MSTPELSTADLQKWLLTVSTHPSGLQAGIQQAQGSHNAVVDQVIDADFGISAAHRLAIYHHGYYARLLNCLQAEYPVLRNAFSPEWFDEMGRRYLAHHPPQTWTLAELGASFPEFLESDRPDGGSEPEPAFDFIVDLARFERARTEVFRGPGIEHADLSSLDAIAEAETLDVIFTLAPSLRLLKLRFDVFTYYSQACQSDEARVPQFGEQHVVISRRNYQVQFREIAPWQFEFLQALSQDVTPRSAINHLRDHAEIDISDTTCHHWLRDCIRHGYFLPARNLEGQAVCMPPRENA